MNESDFFYSFISAYRGQSDYHMQRRRSNETERVSVLLAVPEYSDPKGKPYYNFDYDQYKRGVAAMHGLAIVDNSRRILTKDELSALRDDINKRYTNEGGFEAYHKLTLRRGYYNPPTRSYARIIDNPDGSETHEYFDADTDSWTPFTPDRNN
ncbi:MAG: hypothetical protein L0226_17905 [Acidobacteria bacterium]|nr:hypothetical protein [Acidobacteriota bacterium]